MGVPQAIEGPREDAVKRFWAAKFQLRQDFNDGEDCSASLSEFYDACNGMLDICKERGARLIAADLGC